MAQRHAHSQPIETYGLAPHNRNIWSTATERHTIETYGPQPTNRLRHAWPILLSAFQLVVYPLLTDSKVLKTGVYKYISGFSGAGEVYKYFFGGVYKYFSGAGEVYKYFSAVYINTSSTVSINTSPSRRSIYKYFSGHLPRRRSIR